MSDIFLKPIMRIIRMWYIPLLIGILFIITGIWSLNSPESAISVLGLLFSLSFIFSGIAEIIFSYSNRDILPNWGWILIFGIATLVAGLIIVSNRALSIEVLIYFVGFMIFFRSVRNISFSLDIRSHGGSNWGSLLFLGVLGILVSIIILANPVIGGLSIVFWMALAFMVNGIFGIVLAIQLRKIHKHVKTRLPEIKERIQRLMEEIEDGERRIGE